MALRVIGERLWEPCCATELQTMHIKTKKTHHPPPRSPAIEPPLDRARCTKQEV